MESSPSPPSPPETSPSANPPKGKLFVGGIPWDATDDDLREYFGKYGDVVEAVIMKERGTGNARGFGFVSFLDASSADKIILDASAKHVIHGRPVEVKRAIPRGDQHHPLGKPSPRFNGGARTKKIFVGGLSAGLTQDEFRGYFEQFGKITDVVVMHDSATHRPRGFGFVTFESEAAADGAVRAAFHTLNGKTVEVKKAVPRPYHGLLCRPPHVPAFAPARTYPFPAFAYAGGAVRYGAPGLCPGYFPPFRGGLFLSGGGARPATGLHFGPSHRPNLFIR
ncbi:heterogeneous nuclear ribonucleoprotein 1-like [Wolffia australiana]